MTRPQRRLQSLAAVPPASSTPGSTRKPRARGTTPQTETRPSPLARRRHAASSPIRKGTTLPSPSPENAHAQSSPVKKKRVTFRAELVQRPTEPQAQQTPRKSILKANVAMSAPVMRSLVGDEPQMVEFWSPGNIPGLETAQSATQELDAFGGLIQGGLTLLQSKECNRRFEIYACFHLLLKELSDKKIALLIPHLPDLLKVLKHDLEAIETIIHGKESKNPFLARTDVQIVKIFNVLLSNPKLFNAFWKKSPKPIQGYAKWCISQASSAIRRDTISKSLLSANLQLLKEQRVYSMLTIPVKEYILFALLNMKYFNSASLLLEKIHTIKAMVIHCTPMMEKQAKAWIPVLFNCLCDFSSPMSSKIIAASSIALLETAKAFISSKSVGYEVSKILTDPVHLALNVAPHSLVSVSSTPVDLAQPTINYMADRLNEMTRDNSKVALDLWLGITLLHYSNEQPVQLPMQGTPWYAVLERCLLNGNPETQNLALRTWRAVVYVHANNMELCNYEQFEQRVQMMLKVFNTGIISPVFCSIITQVCYVLFNNPRMNQLPLSTVVDEYLITAMEQLLQNGDPVIAVHVTKVLIQLFGTQSVDQGFYLVKMMSNDKFELAEVKPMSNDVVFHVLPRVFQLFRKQMWNVEGIPDNLKLMLLSALMCRVKGLPQEKLIGKRAEKLCSLCDSFKEFFEEYMALRKPSSTVKEKLDHLNRFLTLLRTNFGPVAFSELADSGELVYSHDNIYLYIVEHSLKLYIKPADLMKLMLEHTKLVKYKFFETLGLRVEDKRILSYISNNLQSVIVDQSITPSSLHALARTIRMIPKSMALLKTFFSIVRMDDSAVSYFHSLGCHSWSTDENVLVYDYINSAYTSLRPQMIQSLSMKLQSREQEFGIKIFMHLLKHDDREALFQLREHLFFYAIDPKSAYDKETNIEMKYILGQWLILSRGDESQLGAILYHGLTLCSTLVSDSKYSTCKPRAQAVMVLLEGVADSVTGMEWPLLDRFRLRGDGASSPRRERVMKPYVMAAMDAVSLVIEEGEERDETTVTPGIDETQVIESQGKCPSDEMDGCLDLEIDSQVVASGMAQVIEPHTSKELIERHVDVMSSTHLIGNDDEASSSGMDETQVIEDHVEIISFVRKTKALGQRMEVLNSSSQELIEKISDDAPIQQSADEMVDSNEEGTENPALLVRTSHDSAEETSHHIGTTGSAELTERLTDVPASTRKTTDTNTASTQIIETDILSLLRRKSVVLSNSVELTEAPNDAQASLDEVSDSNPSTVERIPSDLDSSPCKPSSKHIEDALAPAKRKLEVSPQPKKRQRGVSSMFDEINGMLTPSDDEIRGMSKDERYALETRMMEFMLRMRTIHD